MKVDLIISNCGQLVTCAADGKAKKGAAMRELGIIENGALAVAGGRIAAVGNSTEIARGFESENVSDAKGKVVCPGFVECHTHIVYAGNRLDEFELKIEGADYLEILESGGGILSTVGATRKASLGNLIEDSRKRLDKLLALGVTSCEVKTGYGLDTENELKILAAILELDRIHPTNLTPTILAAHAVPPEFKENPDEYVDLICREILPRAASLFQIYKAFPEDEILTRKEKTSGRAVSFEIREFTEAEMTSFNQDNLIFADVFCEKNAFNLEQSRRILETAKSIGFKLKAHVDEFTNLGAARMAIARGATSIDHLDKISDEEIKLLAASETIGVVTPTVNFNFGSREFADARKMIDAGCALAVSTDYNPGSAPCPSIPNALAIACRYQKLLPSEALNAATINAACAVGAGDKIGSIEAGKYADILILDTDDYRQLAYEFGGNLVETIFKNGVVVKV